MSPKNKDEDYCYKYANNHNLLKQSNIKFKGLPAPTFKWSQSISLFFRLAEPIGSSAPKRASLTESQLTPQLLDETCLVCPVQGSPVPSFR